MIINTFKFRVYDSLNYYIMQFIKVMTCNVVITRDLPCINYSIFTKENYSCSVISLSSPITYGLYPKQGKSLEKRYVTNQITFVML